MKKRKIRGFKRRHRQIEQWRLENLELRFDLIEKYKYDYTKIIVHPWCDISVTRSQIPEPKGKIKQLILSGLIDIYTSWKEQLDKLGKPYYLKIWLCEPRFPRSQVVCAVASDRIDYYENLFFKPSTNKKLDTNIFGTQKSKLDKLKWGYRLDEDHFQNDEIGEPELYLTPEDFIKTKRWFTKLLKKPHRTTKLNKDTVLYSFRKGDLWVGGED